MRFDTISQTACFVVDRVAMRELRITGHKAGYRPRTADHRAMYVGPLAQVSDDFGNVFKRGVMTPMKVYDWQMLARGPAAPQFLLLGPAIESPGRPTETPAAVSSCS